jgi:SAM-dependent methyltransferase
MASQGATVVCSDLTGATAKAIQKHKQHGVSHLISYETVDATKIKYIEHFDIIFFKSVLGGIGANGNKERQAKAVGQMHKALKKGGDLFFAENLLASPAHNLFRRIFVKWGKEWRYVSLEEMHEFLSPFSAVTYRTIGFLGAFGRSERQRGVLSWLDRYLISPLAPSSWRYIVAGVATK